MDPLTIFCINLKSRKDRKANIISQFSQYENVNLIFIEAVDGENLDKHIVTEINNNYKRTKNDFNTRELSKAEIGCLLSHFAAYEMLIKLELNSALIIEDDIIANSDLKNYIFELKQNVRENNIIFVGGDTGIDYFYGRNAWKGINKFKIKLWGRKYFSLGFYVGIPIDRIWGSYAYFIGSYASYTLLNAYRDGYVDVADNTLSNSPKFGIDLLAANKIIFFHNYDLKSDIRAIHTFEANRGIRYGLLSSLKRIISRSFIRSYPYITKLKT